MPGELCILYVGYHNLHLGCFILYVGYYRPCADYHMSYGGCCRYRVGCTFAVWDVSTSMWTLTTSMWDAVFYIWANSSYVWTIATYLWAFKPSAWIFAGAM